jgi:N-sulfoglucosamine sulfohydrolase
VKTLPWMLKQGLRDRTGRQLHVKPGTMLAYDAWLLPEQPGNRDVARWASPANGYVSRLTTIFPDHGL